MAHDHRVILVNAGRLPATPGRLLLAFGASWLCLSAAPAPELERRFREEIQPILQSHCISCHGPEKQRADLNLAEFTAYSGVLERLDLWKEVLGRVMADEMPPAGSRPLPYDKRQALMDWLRKLPSSGIDCNQLATDRTQNFYRGYVMSRPLTRHEYDNTVRDLTGLDFRLFASLPADGAGGEGFDTNGDTLFTSSLSIEKYIEAAEHISFTLLSGKKSKISPEVQAARRRLLVAQPGRKVPPRDAARKVTAHFARRAFRRSVSAQEIDRFLALFDRALKRGDDYETALRLPLQAILVSPHFLFLAEPEPFSGGVQPLAPFPLASRLSYFLWSSMPDEELLGLAESGALADTNAYQAQVARMLRDPKAEALGERFARQWLGIEQLGSETRPDASRFPEFDDSLLQSMIGEVTSYFNYLVREDRPLLELIDSPYTFVNERLAQLYGFDHVQGSELRRVPVKDRSRGGVLGMAAVHASTSYPLRTSPVLRGKWILETLLGERVPPPPPDVPALAVHDATVTAASLREKLEMHRQNAQCAACHNRMDPLGFGMETFDVLGRWRAPGGGSGVDATGELPSGERFSGPGELKDILLRRQEPIMRHFARKLAGYALGRELNRFDDCLIRDATAALQKNAYRPSALIETIVMSLPFRHRFYPAKVPSLSPES